MKILSQTKECPTVEQVWGNEEQVSHQTSSPTPQEVQLESSFPWHSWQVKWHSWHWFINSNLPEGQFKTQRPSSKILEEKQTFRVYKDDFQIALSIRTCGVHVLLYKLGFIVPETRGLPRTDHPRPCGIQVMYHSLAQGLDPTADIPETGWGCNPDSGFK